MIQEILQEFFEHLGKEVDMFHDHLVCETILGSEHNVTLISFDTQLNVGDLPRLFRSCNLQQRHLEQCVFGSSYHHYNASDYDIILRRMM